MFLKADLFWLAGYIWLAPVWDPHTVFPTEEMEEGESSRGKIPPTRLSHQIFIPSDLNCNMFISFECSNDCGVVDVKMNGPFFIRKSFCNVKME